MSNTIDTPHDYALAMGWDYTQIEETAANGVSDCDVAALSATDVTEDALLAWCRERVAAAGETKMRTIKLTGGDLGAEVVKVRANLTRPETPIEVDYCEGAGWQGCQYQSAETSGRLSKLIEIGKELAAAAVEIPASDFSCDASEI